MVSGQALELTEQGTIDAKQASGPVDRKDVVVQRRLPPERRTAL